MILLFDIKINSLFKKKKSDLKINHSYQNIILFT